MGAPPHQLTRGLWSPPGRVVPVDCCRRGRERSRWKPGADPQPSQPDRTAASEVPVVVCGYGDPAVGADRPTAEVDMNAFAPRLLHPGAWWIWALGLATAAARTTNPLLLLLIAAAAGVVVAERRVPGPWSRSYLAFVSLGLVVIGVRVLFEIVFGGNDLGVVLVEFPGYPPDWLAGIQLGGPLTLDGLLLAVFEGLRLAVILACVGAANSLVNPSRLLRLVPAALYEAGVAVVVCMSVTPILITDAGRIRRAGDYVGVPPAAPARLRGEIALPLFSGALERSVALAASMDARGYGRAVEPIRADAASTAPWWSWVSRRHRGGCTGLLDSGTPGVAGVGIIGWPMLLIGAALAAAGSLIAGRRVTRTRYRPDPWRLPEWLVAGCGVVPAVVFVLTPTDILLGSASPPGWPTCRCFRRWRSPWPALPAVVARACRACDRPHTSSPRRWPRDHFRPGQHHLSRSSRTRAAM